jgi:CHAD domain-containing protein
VHDARRSLKKARAGLRLLRPALGAVVYRRENSALRAAAHGLNAARDAQVLLQTLRSLQRARPLRTSTAAARVARWLHGARAAAQDRLSRDRVLVSVREAVEQAERRARHWRVGRRGWTALGPALRRIYRSGRRRVPSARTMPPDEALHEWRKQVKYLRYALKMLRPIAPGPLGALERRARELSDRLGEAHDLALLARQVSVYGAIRGARARRTDGLQELLDVIERRRERLASAALAEGELLYRGQPRALERRFARAWRRWRLSTS